MGASIIFFALGHKSEPALRVPPGTPLPPAEGSAGFVAEAAAELPTHASLSVLPSKRSSPHRRRAARAPRPRPLDTDGGTRPGMRRLLLLLLSSQQPPPSSLLLLPPWMGAQGGREQIIL